MAAALSGVLNRNEILPGEAEQLVAAVAAVEDVVAEVAAHRVAVGVAGEIDRRVTEVESGCQQLDISPGGQGEAHGTPDGVDALAAAFVDRVRDAVDDVGIVAGTSGQLVVAAAAVDDVVAVVADDLVAAGIAGQVDRRSAEVEVGPQRLDIGAHQQIKLILVNTVSTPWPANSVIVSKASSTA